MKTNTGATDKLIRSYEQVQGRLSGDNVDGGPVGELSAWLPVFREVVGGSMNRSVWRCHVNAKCEM